MDWTESPLPEVVPGKLSGAPVIVHARVRPDDLIANREQGPECQAEHDDLPIGTVQALLEFDQRRMSRIAYPA